MGEERVDRRRWTSRFEKGVGFGASRIEGGIEQEEAEYYSVV